jgi:hypothetical protein
MITFSRCACRWWICALLVFAIAQQNAGAQAPGEIRVAFTPDPKDTQTAIGGYLTGDPATLARIQSVYLEVVNGSDDVDKDADIVQGPTDANYSASTYSFAASNLKALAEGQSVHVHVCGSSAYSGTTASGSPTITGIPSTGLLQAGWPITGTGIPSGATIASVDSATQITISANATAAGTVALQFGGKAPVEQSCAEAGPQSASGGSAAKAGAIEIVPLNPTIDVVGLYDLGRLKTYFSVGAEFQGTNGSLGTASGFFGVDIDENWLTTGPDTDPACFSASDSASFRNQVKARLMAKATEKARAQSQAVSIPGACGTHPFRFLINTYAEAELTQIPLTSSSSGSSGTPAASAVHASATTSGGTAAPPSSGTFNISSAKGAYVEGGVYTPFLFPSMQWHFRGQANAFFIAPLAKYAFLDPDSTPAGSTTAFNVYRAYGGGFRLGHFRLPAHFNKEGPELLSYLDITGGKWENYRESNGTRGARLDVSGRYKIPFTILYIGFDANLGPGGSDFRLFAGTRVDVSSILGKLLPSTN